ncbi:SH3 domain-containing protein [Aureimonas psammosilenae]|uniref:SH3 domain-containing protein n=1 Tax=Aureimonas psammosilenae TaxID=2495496 RepID=UPI0012604C14|nr:SH3 domain-containing protein [Aureimonas psammosilenae]
MSAPRPFLRSLLALVLVAMAATGLSTHSGFAATGEEAGAAPEEETAESAAEAGAHSKLPLPRFVSLKSARVNLRVGPGKDYAVSWLYMKPGLPVEIVQEFELWRRIRDSEGTEGWVYHSLLSGTRTGIAAPWLTGKATTIDVRRSAAEDSSLVAKMEPGVVSKVRECAFSWCQVEISGRKGYVHQNDIWGVYPDEKF